MIAVDTSALMAILLDEPEADACMGVLEAEPQVLISAGTFAEALIVAARRGAGQKMAQLIDGLGLNVIPVTAASARRMAEAYDRWGKGVHPAGLNLGDCFAYEVAKEHGCPLLFIGNDFSRTDLESAL
nr:type II toxin-antitoxin system VapC family toxin [uncultured Rhodopila sp.]